MPNSSPKWLDQIIQQRMQMFRLLHTLPTPGIVFLVLTILVGVQFYHIESLNMFFLISNGVEHFICSLAIWFPLLWGACWSLLPVFSIGLFVFFLLSFKNCLYILKHFPLTYKYCLELQESLLKFFAFFFLEIIKYFKRQTHAQMLNVVSCCQMLNFLVGL